MGKSVWDLLVGALEDLDLEQFNKFLGKLTDSGREPRVRRGTVYNKGREDVARKLIETYTEQRALTVTVEILEAIDCRQIAKDLKDDAADNGHSLSGGAEGSGDPSGGGASTAKIPSTEFSKAEFIDKNRTELIQRTTGVEAILDVLLQEKVINNEQYNEICSESTTQNKMRALFRGPITSCGPKGKAVLYDALMDQHLYLMEDLGARKT